MRLTSICLLTLFIIAARSLNVQTSSHQDSEAPQITPYTAMPELPRSAQVL